MTLRQLLVYVRRLPRDSALARELDPDVDWTLEAHLLAGLFDATQVGNWQRGNAGAKSPTPRPKPLPRPGVTNKNDPRVIRARAERFKARQARQRRARPQQQ